MKDFQKNLNAFALSLARHGAKRLLFTAARRPAKPGFERGYSGKPRRVQIPAN
jgi:hypothetical protein